MLTFRDNPKELLTQIAEAWEYFSQNFSRLYSEANSSVVSTRWATKDMFKSHPLFGVLDTAFTTEPWTPFARRWLIAPGPNDNLPWKHSFDSNGRIIFAKNVVWGYMTVWREDVCFRLRITKSERKNKFELSTQNGGHEFSGYWYNSNGQIECLCDCSFHHGSAERLFEWFGFDSNLCVESIQQWFEIKPDIQPYDQGESENELGTIYRILDGNGLIYNTVERMDLRCRIKYTYLQTGEILRAEKFDFEGKPLEKLLYEKQEVRSLEEALDDLVEKTASTIDKAVTKRSQIKPYRSLILIYSAEHPHCGLPHEVAVLGHDSASPKDKYCQESYKNKLEVIFRRPVLSVLNEFVQRCYARFAFDDIAAQNQVVVSAMQSIAEKLLGAFAKTKHVTDDFEVIVIDDHGDVDSFSVSNPGS